MHAEVANLELQLGLLDRSEWPTENQWKAATWGRPGPGAAADARIMLAFRVCTS